MANITVVCNLDEIPEMSTGLGMWLWNIAVSNAPYDTGNLRSAIGLRSNTKKTKNITYNVGVAHYLHFLEEGIGPIKKHRGFISNQTVGDFIYELANYFVTGKEPLITSPPRVYFRRSEQGPMFHERKMINQIQRKSEKFLSASDRRKMSILKNQNYYKGELSSIATVTPRVHGRLPIRGFREG